MDAAWDKDYFTPVPLVSQAALAALGDGAERDLRIIEAVADLPAREAVIGLVHRRLLQDLTGSAD